MERADRERRKLQEQIEKTIARVRDAITNAPPPCALPQVHEREIFAIVHCKYSVAFRPVRTARALHSPPLVLWNFIYKYCSCCLEPTDYCRFNPIRARAETAHFPAVIPKSRCTNFPAQTLRLRQLYEDYNVDCR